MALILRLNKAAPLTNQEVDDNFVYLDTRITDVSNAKLDVSGLLAAIKLIDGLGSGIDADRLQNLLPTDQNVVSSIVARDASGNFSAGTITAALNGNAASASVATSFAGIIPFANGGTGVSALTAGYVKSTGTILTTTVSIPGTDVSGNIPGNAANVTGTIAVANGGTGATSASGARVALGLVIGQTIQGYAANLQALSGMGTNGLMYRSGFTYGTRLFEVGNGLTITNADLSAGNPKISISVVPIANGGTGASSSQAALLALGGVSANNAALTGTPTCPTATAGSNTTQIANTAYVKLMEVPTATVVFMARTTPPAEYILANGATYNITSYPDLYAVIGLNYGSGGGGTFNVPNVTAPAGLISCIKI